MLFCFSFSDVLLSWFATWLTGGDGTGATDGCEGAGVGAGLEIGACRTVC